MKNKIVIDVELPNNITDDFVLVYRKEKGCFVAIHKDVFLGDLKKESENTYIYIKEQLKMLTSKINGLNERFSKLVNIVKENIEK